MKLSPYTIASNCTDLTDIQDAINEINDYFKHRNIIKKKIPNFVYIRYYKLSEKMKKMEGV